MEKAAIEQVKKRDLGGECHVYKHPIPEHGKIIFFEARYQGDFGIVHLGERNTEDDEVEKCQHDPEDLVSAE